MRNEQTYKKQLTPSEQVDTTLVVFILTLIVGYIGLFIYTITAQTI